MPNDHEPEPPTHLSRTFIQVLLLEAVIVAALWWFGRVYS